jgi:hypothetical protein
MSSWNGTSWVPETTTPAHVPARRPHRIVRLPVLAVVTLAVAAAVALPQTPVAAAHRASTAATPNTDFILDASANRTRSKPFALNGATLAGDRYVFLATKTVASTVTFWLDDVAMTTTPMRVEKAAPWDLRGTADNETANAWNTATVANGSHTISVTAATAAGRATTSATFVVANRTTTPTPTPTPTVATGPRISAVTATSIGSTGAIVSWSLDEPATGQVEFGTTTAYGRLTTEETSFRYSAHVQQVSGLLAGTVYHFRVRSQDAAGRLSVSSDDTFRTIGVAATPTATPTVAPTTTPTQTPVPTNAPTATPTSAPTATPTSAPTATPTSAPTATPTVAPTATPTSAPTATPTVAPTATPAAGQTGTYGAAFNFDTKANLQVGWTDHAKVAHRFVATTTSTLKSIRFQQRGGPVYSGGTGGTLRITVQTDSNGVPSGTVLATASYTPGNSGVWTHYDVVTFSSPATLTKGTRYNIVFENVDANSAANYFSVNELYTYSTVTPRQPAFADADYAVLYAAPSTWSVQSKYTADMDLTYADGTHDGMAYIANIIELYGTVSGSASVREHFTVSGGNRAVTKASVRVRRTSGSSPLTIRLETGTGTLIEAVDVPASSIAASAPGGDNGGSVWVTVTFSNPHTLANGAAYNLRLTTATGTTYTSAPIREGTDVGLLSTAFRDGSGQSSSNGTSWADLYAYSPVDIQFYFR